MNARWTIERRTKTQSCSTFWLKRAKANSKEKLMQPLTHKVAYRQAVAVTTTTTTSDIRRRRRRPHSNSNASWTTLWTMRWGCTIRFTPRSRRKSWPTSPRSPRSARSRGKASMNPKQPWANYSNKVWMLPRSVFIKIIRKTNSSV